MSERISITEFRKMAGVGADIAETPLSAQIKELMDRLGLENDRIQAGKLYVVTKYKSRKTGKEKEHGRWIQMAKKGTPDRWCIIHKRWVVVEIKTKGKKPTPDQIKRQKELERAGAIILNVDSLETAEKQIKGLMRDLDPRRKFRILKNELTELLWSFENSEPSPDFAAQKILELVEERFL